MDNQLQDAAHLDNDDSAISALRKEPLFKLKLPPTILLMSYTSLAFHQTSVPFPRHYTPSYEHPKLLHPVTFRAPPSIELRSEHCPVTLYFDWGTPCGRTELPGYFPPALPRRALQYLRKCQLVLA